MTTIEAAGAPVSERCDLFRNARMTIGGGYRVQFVACPQRVPVGAATWWTVRVTSRAEAPRVRRLDVEGGMPDHGHGFLTAPVVTRTETPGIFRARLAFAMRGRWVIELRVVARGRGEVVRYQLTI